MGAKERNADTRAKNKTWDNNLFFDPGSIYSAESRETSLVLEWVNECMLSGNEEEEREVGTGTGTERIHRKTEWPANVWRRVEKVMVNKNKAVDLHSGSACSSVCLPHHSFATSNSVTNDGELYSAIICSLTLYRYLLHLHTTQISQVRHN